MGKYLILAISYFDPDPKIHKSYFHNKPQMEIFYFNIDKQLLEIWNWRSHNIEHTVPLKIEKLHDCDKVRSI